MKFTFDNLMKVFSILSILACAVGWIYSRGGDVTQLVSKVEKLDSYTVDFAKNEKIFSEKLVEIEKNNLQLASRIQSLEKSELAGTALQIKQQEQLLEIAKALERLQTNTEFIIKQIDKKQ